MSMLARVITSPRIAVGTSAPPIEDSRRVACVLTAGNMEPTVETLVGRCPAGLAAVTSQSSDAVEGWCEQRDRSAVGLLEQTHSFLVLPEQRAREGRSCALPRWCKLLAAM